MSDRICSIEACERKILARGWCSKHYNSWLATADRSLVRDRLAQEGPCVVEGCQKEAVTRGFCSGHYKLWRKHGSPTPRRRGEIVDGKRLCARCGVDRVLSEWGQGSYCKPCGRQRARAYAIPTTTGLTQCEVCGSTFGANKKQRFHCSTGCKVIGENKRNQKHVLIRRARKRNATIEDFAPQEIYERDAWTCRICALPIDRMLRAPSPGSPSIDHMIPLARGGAHSRGNTQAAHLGCNVRKGVKVATPT